MIIFITYYLDGVNKIFFNSIISKTSHKFECFDKPLFVLFSKYSYLIYNSHNTTNTNSQVCNLYQ